MRLTRLALRDVKRHGALSLELARGLTVIRGPNESGKSTIQRAIELALFRRATSVAELESMRPWGAPDADPTIELEFEADGVQGRLTKVFAGSRGSVELELAGQAITDPGTVDQTIAELTGLPSEKFFRSTASVRQHELTGLDRDEGALRDRLQRSMSASDRGTHAARRKLEEVIRRYRTEGHKNPGHLKVARDGIARLRAEAARGESDLARLERDRRALAEARTARRSAEEHLEEERRRLETAERAVMLEARLESAERRYAAYRRAAELEESIARLEARRPSPLPLDVLRPTVERLRSLEYRVSDLRAELARDSARDADEQRTQAASPAPAWRPWALAAAVLTLVAVVLAVLGASIIGPDGLLLVVVVGLSAVATATVAVRLRRAEAEGSATQQTRRVELERTQRHRAGLADELRDVEAERDGSLARLALRDVAAADALLGAEVEHAATIDRLRAEWRGRMADAPTGDDVAALRDRVANEVDECRHALAGLAGVGRDPRSALARAQAAVRTLVAEREAALAAEAAAGARVEQNGTDAEQVAAVGEALAEAERRLATLERRVRIYETTLDAIVEAERATMQRAARFLEGQMSSDVERLTGGRYRRVQVDEDELRFRAWSVEREDWVDVTSLSQGTMDLFYLAARLGLVRQVSQGRRPPLVFDDPFVTFDDERARRAVALLRELARDHQVIYLTCSDRYDSAADVVVELAPPTGRDLAASPVARVGRAEPLAEPLPLPGLVPAAASLGAGSERPPAGARAVATGSRGAGRHAAPDGPSLWDEEASSLAVPGTPERA